jgi:uncharacterized protein (DUF2236 family)
MQIPHQAGLYTPRNMLWRIHREGIVALAAARALLLELAHPMVAAGVADHSDFRHRPMRRLFGTLLVMQRLSFGDLRAAQWAARHTNQCHQKVKGVLATGEAYDADDPHLRLWVLATIIDSTTRAYDRFIAPLSDSERAEYYEDSKEMARMFGIPASVMPATYADFCAYIQHTIDETLLVGLQAREILDALFHHPLTGWLVRLASWVGIGMLPEHIRTGFDLAWTAQDEQRSLWLAGITRRLRPYLPNLLVIHPQAWIGELRYQMANRKHTAT